MTLLEEKLQEIKQRDEIGLMTHVVIGYPSLEDTVKIVETMVKGGADIVELQIPFSDPLADGPTIMRACETSLRNGTKISDAFKIMKTLSSRIKIPLLFMAYYNTVFKYGVEKFCAAAAAAGASGLIVPDMAIDEEGEEHFFEFCRKYNLHNIQVISQSSTDERLKKNKQFANGFVYCAAHQGTTGAQDKLDPNLESYLKKIKETFSIPIAVGFGISKREHIEGLKPYADVAIVGSAIIDIINSSKSGEFENNIKGFLSQLKGQN